MSGCSWVRDDNLERELVLGNPASFVPLVMTECGKEVEYGAKST
jgi:hypothetical protein